MKLIELVLLEVIEEVVCFAALYALEGFRNELEVWLETVGSRLLIECCDPCNIFFLADRISLPNRQASPTFFYWPSTLSGKPLHWFLIPITKVLGV